MRRPDPRDGGGAYQLIFVEDGGEIVVRGTRETRTRPNTLMLTRGTCPYEIEQIGSLSALTALIPGSILKSYYPNIDDWCFRTIDASEGAAGILRDTLLSFWRQHASVKPVAIGDLTSSLVQLIGSVFRSCGHEPDFESRSTQMHFLRVRSLIAESLDNPALGADFVSERLRISKSYLCKIMKAADTTLGRLILEQRLQRSRELLANPSMKTWSVSDIAYAVGFQDLAHLSRRFSEHFGKSPTAFRAEVYAQAAEQTTT